MRDLLLIAQNSMTAYKYLIAVITLIITVPFAIIGIKESYYKLYSYLYGPSQHEIETAIETIEKVKERAKQS
jgi:hypothetical protein